MKQIEIVKKGDRWVAESTSGVIAKAKTKQAAVRRAATTAKADKQSVYVEFTKPMAEFKRSGHTLRSSPPRS